MKFGAERRMVLPGEISALLRSGFGDCVELRISVFKFVWIVFKVLYRFLFQLPWQKWSEAAPTGKVEL